MTIAVIGATGRAGSEIVRGLLARGNPVTTIVRDPGKARRVFGERVGRAACGPGSAPTAIRPRSAERHLAGAGS